MSMSAPRVFTIPASVPFLPRMFGAFRTGHLVPGFPATDDPLALANATFYLPTRRACRLARDIFLDVAGTDVAVLPRILPIGDIDEDELVFSDTATGPAAETALEIPPALGGLQRRMLLAQLVLEWARAPKVRGIEGAHLVASSPASALALADSLARLIDDMTTRKVPWSKLDTLVPDDFDEYWQLSLEFLKIAREAWPRILAERGAIEPAERRDLLIAAEAARLASRGDGPVIAAGSTGSMPATAALLDRIARLPHGAVVLPGLDTELPEAAWTMIGDGADARGMPGFGHAQFAMHGLLARLGIARRDVTVLGAAALPEREKLVSEALCPAAASDCWRERLPEPTIDAALAGMSVLEADTAEQEALAIAVALREALTHPGKTAVLVTPDRALARRVVAALARWNVAVDDSAGDRLAETPAGVFARLAAEIALDGTPPVPLLALLKHPLARLGMNDRAHARATAALERAILRGPRPKPGTAGLRRALATFRSEKDSNGLYRTDPRRGLRDADLDAAAALIDRLEKALAPLIGIDAETCLFADVAARHRDVVLALADDGRGAAPRLESEDGNALLLAFDNIAAAGAEFPVATAEYGELFHAAIADRVVRRPSRPDVRVRIFGLLEARLQSADLIILGGLVEGTWPPEARTDAWLSRPMRHALGLDLPERRIGLTAHDFAQALGAREVILTRAAKLAGAPTLWSRFVQRLAAVAGESAWRQALERGARYVVLARGLDHAAEPRSVKAPAPVPPRDARPTRLSVTEIEDWLRDPYTIYARHVLRLIPLDAVDTPPGAADRGSAIHAAIGEFTERYAGGLPANPVAELIEIGRAQFAHLEDYPEARAFWWPRFVRIAHWFAGWDAERRAALTAVYPEQGGRMTFPVGDYTFTLTGRADRVERLHDGRYIILDFKTGQLPSDRQVLVGFAPQLTLEAAMLTQGGFDIVPAGSSVAELVYVRLSGGEPPGISRSVSFNDSGPDSHANRALMKLKGVASRFLVDGEPYRSLVRPMWRTRYGDYDHLGRVKEWSLTGGEIEDGVAG